MALSNSDSFIKSGKIGEISIDDFLQNYWQKKPLLIRQAVPGFNAFITADELAGLSCEEDVESRLLIENGLDGKTPWQLFNGPMPESVFSQLPETNWTLLIQEANRHIPQLQELIDYFSFIPNWRFDDVMISYAPKNGSVGPHSDQYDVFLLQAYGQRHWHIADYPTSEDDLIEGIGCRILKTFHSQSDWVLNPGDMLYLPPGIIHHGIAVDDCQTYSFGFRTGTNGDLLSGILAYAIEAGKLNSYYHDPELVQQKSCGEISEKALIKLEQQLHELFDDKKLLRQWIARYLTENINPDREDKDSHTVSLSLVQNNLLRQKTLYRNEACRYAYLRLQDNQYQLYINAEIIDVPSQLMEFIPVLTGSRILDEKKIAPFITIKGFDSFIKTLIEKQYLSY